MAASIPVALDASRKLDDADAMKTKRRLLTREELLDVEDKYFGGGLGNLLSLGAAHFRQSNPKSGRRVRRNGSDHHRKAAAG